MFEFKGAGRAAAALAAGLLCAGAVALGAGPAAAKTLIKATYHGTVTNLLDKDALLGTEIDVLTASNLAFTDTYVYDLGKGTRITTANTDQVEGGDVFGTASPLVSSKLTIGGVTLNFLGTRISQQINKTGQFIGSGAQWLDVNDVFSRNDILAFTNAPALITTPYSGSASSSGLTAFICTGGHTCSGEFRFRADLAASSVEITTSTVPDVPEPASWALMILGFGGMGAALRRARGGATADQVAI